MLNLNGLRVALTLNFDAQKDTRCDIVLCIEGHFQKALVVEQLPEGSVPTEEDTGSNPVIDKVKDK